MSFAYLPLYTGDYLRDTRHLSPLRHGVYLLLLMHCWDQKGPVPLDEQEAAGIANCRSQDEIDALRYILDRYFTRMDDGHYNKRMAEIVADAERLSKRLHDAGLRSAEVRREKARRGAAAKAEARLNLGLTKAEPRSESPTPTPTSTLTPEKMGRDLKVSTSSESVDSDQADVVVAEKQKTAYRLPDCPYQALVDAYHDLLPACPRVEVLSDQRKRHMQARWRQVCADEKLDRAAGLQWFRDFFEHVGKSAFLTGKTKPTDGRKPFFASLDWLMSAEKFVHVYEGRYHR